MSPINIPVLQEYLTGYPDIESAEFLLKGFQYGFPLHVDRTFEPPWDPIIVVNHSLARLHSAIVEEKIATELAAGRVWGPSSTPVKGVLYSPLNLVESKSKPGKFRLVHDLGYPRSGNSVNSHISDVHANVQYSKFDNVVDTIATLGIGALVATIDIKSAFRLMPIAPEDYKYVGFVHNTHFYTDLVTPFGARSSCQNFERFSTFIQWKVQQDAALSYSSHYLDDHIMYGGADSRDCQRIFDIFHQVCDKMGVPIAHDKTQSPRTNIVYLGLVIDTVAQEVRVPTEKLDCAVNLIRDSLSRKRVCKRYLQQIIGYLGFLCRAVRGGRSHLRRLIDLCHTLKAPHHFLHLSVGTKLDLQLWLEFLQEFNGTPIIQFPLFYQKHLLVSDASQIGFGLTCHPHFSSVKWPYQVLDKGHGIGTLELFSILVGVHLWTSKLSNSVVTIATDHMPLVTSINKQSCKSKDLMNLIRPLVLWALKYNSRIQAVFMDISDKHMVACDALSRLQIHEFLKHAPPGSERHPTPMIDHLWQHLTQKPQD